MSCGDFRDLEQRGAEQARRRQQQRVYQDGPPEHSHPGKSSSENCSAWEIAVDAAVASCLECSWFVVRSGRGPGVARVAALASDGDLRPPQPAARRE